MNALKDERRALPAIEPVSDFQATEPDNAAVAFAIVFLGTCAFLLGGVLWLFLR